MTKEELLQYRHLCREIKQEQKNKQELLKDLKQYEQSAYTVKASLPYFPYTKYCVMVGADFGNEYEEEISITQTNLEKLKMERDKIRTYVEAIHDSELRQIFTLRYLNGLGWEQVGKKMGLGYTADSVRKKAERYLY